ncbi:uncharacterized protein LDX57_005466 [Aspergillus melleus]|uniref:uncharacterized protein n=1 Tax=Aspergillus melleus TaxID=138277 RepID=UPI001E8CC756|nr:uncharacterized protein LDX57_005466 [Aspergillus melleus]KAH8427759.1 hypothetical protein LDX57_005466 [Aspergillus melleus]
MDTDRIVFPPPPMMFPPMEHPKPPVPYIPGWKFDAKSHTPPPPTLVARDCCINSESDRTERQHMDPVDRCLKWPPLPGKEGDDTISLEIIDILKGGDEHNSQVFTVQLSSSTSPLPPRKGTKLVAKVYDPVYFDDDEGYLNQFACMDKYYTHEANAYPVLRELQGHSIPKYYGSYSLYLPTDGEQTRTVRMILIEYISGTTLANADPKSFPQPVRQHIMKSIVDLESRIYEKDLLLLDVEPRNVIIRSPTSDQPHPQVVFFDFAHALFNRRRDDPIALKVNSFLGEYISPILRWNERRDHAFPFSDWIDWDWDSWLGVEFAHTVAGITPEMRERWSDIY